MITKEQLLAGTKTTKQVEIDNYTFTLRALNAGEIATITAIQMHGIEMEMRETLRSPVKMEMSKFLQNKSMSDFKLLSLAIVNEKWTEEEVSQLSTDTVRKLVDIVNELSGITDDSRRLIEEFR